MKYLTAITAAIALCAGFASVRAQAQTVADSRADFARRLYASAPAEVHHQAPQPLLRAVVVLRVRLGDGGRWQAEVLRDNPLRPELTRKALDSVARVAVPHDLSDAWPEALREELRVNGFVEAWLFEDDGRFALKTLARPQQGG